MKIGGFLPTTLLDYPEHLACTVFTQGCNLRCPYCQNGALVLPAHYEAPLDEAWVLDRIRKRSAVLDGVCVSGGEPTLQEGLADFLARVKSMGLSVKLDTNGSHPEILKELWSRRLIDMVAMDVKDAPSRYPDACGCAASDVAAYGASIDFLLRSGIDYEFRTTLVKGMHSPEGMRELAAWLDGAQAYYLQSYEESPQVLYLLAQRDAGLAMDGLPAVERRGCGSFAPAKLQEFLEIARQYVPNAQLRGVPS